MSSARWWLLGAAAVAAVAWFLSSRPPPCCGDPMDEEYDFIVVGSGSAGSVLAARLAERSSASVLLVEAGGDDSHSDVGVPLAAGLLQLTPRDWMYVTEPLQHTGEAFNDRRSHWPRGKLLGGSSSINYMVYVRGHASDYDDWAALTQDGEWDFEHVLPLFRRMETWHGRNDKSGKEKSDKDKSEDEYHGYSGPLDVTVPTRDDVNPMTVAFVEAVQRVLGLPYADYNGAEQLAVDITHTTVTPDGVRESAARAFLKPVHEQRKGNLHVATHAMVTRILFDHDSQSQKEDQDQQQPRAVGIEYVSLHPDRMPYKGKIKARKEVIICSGAIGSPHLLMLSGIGPRDQLEKFGIPVVADKAGVGSHLLDHVSILPGYFTNPGTAITPEKAFSLSALLNYMAFGKGTLRSIAVEGTAFFRTKLAPHPRAPDMQLHFMPLCADAKVMANCNNNISKMKEAGMPHDCVDQFHVLPILLHPYSEGKISLRSGSPVDPPIIDANYFSDPRDVDTMVEALKTVDKMVQDKAFAPFNPRLATIRSAHSPGSDEYWRDFIRFAPYTIYHPGGTCKMGMVSDPLAVVDSKLRVIGVKSLRVADASIFPTLPSGNTNAPAMLVGERAADMLLREYGLE